MAKSSLAQLGHRAKVFTAAVIITGITLTAPGAGLVGVADQEPGQPQGWPPCAQVVAEPTDGECKAYEQAARKNGLLQAEDGSYVPASFYADGE